MSYYSIYLATEKEKYLLMSIVRRAGAILADVAGCGTGYNLSIKATPLQVETINREWSVTTC